MPAYGFRMRNVHAVTNTIEYRKQELQSGLETECCFGSDCESIERI